MTIDENIKRYRVRKHMTQAELAEAVGTTLRMLQRYEAPEETSNSVIPSVPILRKIAQVLEVNISNIIEDDSFVDQSTSINHFYNNLTEKFIENDIMNLKTDRIKGSSFYYTYKIIYDEYQLEKHTEMNALDFLVTDAVFAQNLYEQIISFTIGSTIQNLVKIKLGKNKPVTTDTIMYKNLSERDWIIIDTIMEIFDDKDKLYKLLQQIISKQNDNSGSTAPEDIESAKESIKINR